MAQITMTLAANDGSNPVTLTSKNFTAADRRAFLDSNRVSFFGLLAGRGYNMNNLQHTALQRCGSTTVRFYKGPNDTDTYYSKMKDAVKKALEYIEGDPALRFPNNELQVFCAESSDLSLGYLYRVGTTEYAAITLGRTSVSWSGAIMTKTVAQEVQDHYLPALTVNAMTRRICTIAVHEMGHVFHQMRNLEHYITLARVAELAGEGISVEAVDARVLANVGKLDDFGVRPTATQLMHFVRHTKQRGAGVSYYAYTSGLNELVAETFSALVMGAPVGNDAGVDTQYLPQQTDNAAVMAAYGILGGPMPAAGAQHVRK